VAHWFYLYIVWFTPFVLVALFALYRGDAAAPHVVRADIESEEQRADSETETEPVVASA
jgi:hypothetical protein